MKFSVCFVGLILIASSSQCFAQSNTTAVTSPVAYVYVGNEPGKSWAAYKTWESRKGDLKAEIVKELRIVAELYDYTQLEKLLKTNQNRRQTGLSPTESDNRKL